MNPMSLLSMSADVLRASHNSGATPSVARDDDKRSPMFAMLAIVSIAIVVSLGAIAALSVAL